MNIVITGASGSIGMAVAKKFAQSGRKFVLHAHRRLNVIRELCEEVKKQGCEVKALTADFSSVADITRFTDETFQFLGSCDVLIHSAAVFQKTPVFQVQESEWDAMMSLNLKGPFFLAQKFAQKMTNGGKMIFLSDVAASHPYPGYLPYCISKAGIDCLTKGLAKALQPQIKVFAVRPSVVTRPSDMSNDEWEKLLKKLPDGRAETPEEVAEVILRVTIDDSIPSGSIIDVRGDS